MSEIKSLILNIQEYIARIEKGVIKAQEAEDFFADSIRKARDIFKQDTDKWRILDRWQNESRYMWFAVYKSGVYAEEGQKKKIKNLLNKLIEINKSESVTTTTEQGNGTPRIIHLKMLYGDEFIDYIKDEVGVDNFLKDVFTRKEEQKRDFILNDKTAEIFFKKWASFVHKYKNLYGQAVRDADAISKLQQAGILADNSLYQFRNKLFKSDFEFNKAFVAELEENMKKLDEADSKLDLPLSGKDKKRIESKTW